MSVSTGLFSMRMSPIEKRSPISPNEASAALPSISSSVATEVTWGSTSSAMPVLRIVSVPTAATSSDERSVIPSPSIIRRLTLPRAVKASTSACDRSAKSPS